MKKFNLLPSLCLIAVLGAPAFAQAQVAGSSTVDVTVSEATQLALGWSAKKSILGKTVYNETGQKVGKVEDLIVAPSRNVSFLIIGAGGFVGIGRHDVAVPVDRIQNQGGKLLMPGATKAMVKGMPAFTYASDTMRRDEFIAATNKEIALAKTRLAELRSAAATATADGKASLSAHVTTLEGDLQVADAKLGELKRASIQRWTAFEADVNAAMAHLRQSLHNAKS